MKKLSILLLIFIHISFVHCQEGKIHYPAYHTYTDYLLAPPGEMDIGLYGFINPAVLAHVNAIDSLFAFSGPSPDFTPVTQWGLFAAFPGLGFGTMHTKQPDKTWIKKYRVALGYGTKAFSMGFGYDWTETEGTEHHITCGILSRPVRYLSFGLSGYTSIDLDTYEVALELGIRPFGNDILTLYSDYALLNPGTWRDMLDGSASIGLTARFPFVKGFYITGRYFPRRLDFSFGLKVSTGYAAATYMAKLDNLIDFARYTCSIRAGLAEPNPMEILKKGKSYLLLTMNGYLDYRSRSLVYRSQTFLDILCSILEAKTDPAIAGILMNTSGFFTDSEKIWEIREALIDFKSSGKKVVVYLESADMDMYFLASVADSIVCDPLGTINLKGHIMGMSYYKGLLEKAGIGFEELRLYEYKSANEIFSRETMSGAHREQVNEYLTDLSIYTQKAICESRGFSENDYSRFVNEITLFTAREALSNNLIDATGRFDKAEEEIKRIEGKKMNLINPGSFTERNRPYPVDWRSRKKIAVIYALGICDMDTGIAARYLSGDIDAVSSDPGIKAVVIRVDSPGGSAIASDVIADAIKRCRKEKPVIISQGYVAASGGYWISTYGDVIVASPYTLTGSIGVAGGWFYDNGLKEKLGITTDYVKKGEYADFGFGMYIPYIYISLPDRKLNQGEREMLEKYMSGMYEDFIKKVAEGRQMSEKQIEEIAQGRIWSGIKAKEKGLIDEIGGLVKAIMIAKQRAGIPMSAPVDIVEFPRVDPLSMYASYIKTIGLQVREGKQYSMHYDMKDLLSYRIEHNGKPLPVIDVYTLDLLLPYFILQEKGNDRIPGTLF